MTTTTFPKTFTHSGLEPYISCIVFRKVQVKELQGLVQKIMPPNPLTAMDFFFGHPFKTIDLISGKEVPYKTSAIRGCRIKSKHLIEFNRPFSSISIKFTPTGLYNLLGIEMCKLTDADIPCSSLSLPFDVEQIYKQLNQQNDPDRQLTILEENLQHAFCWKNKKARLNESFYPTTEPGVPQTFLSPRQQERLFLREVGLSPKLYSRLQKFTSLLKYKKLNPDKKWTSLAHEFGYFDQPHLIRAFHFFLGIAPTQFNAVAYAL